MQQVRFEVNPGNPNNSEAVGNRTGHGKTRDAARTSKGAEMGLLSMGRGYGLRSQVSLFRAIRAYGCTWGPA